MACFSGPNIVDDGLLVAYDAANTKSYRGSALINRYYTQTGNSANTNIWDKVGLSASSNVAIDSSRGTWNGNTIFKATVAASGSYLSYQSIRKCIAASHNTAIGTSRRLTFKVRMLEPSSTAISNISYHNGGGTAGHNSSHFTLLDESEVPADSIIKDNWYLLELDVSGTYSSGHCVGIGLPSAHSQAVTFLFTELMVYRSADSGSEPQPFTPTERSATDGFEDMISTNDGDLSGTYQHNDNKKSIVFDGSNDYVDSGNLGSGFNDYTVIAWFYPTSVTNHENVLDCNYSTNSNTGNLGPRLEMNSSGGLTWIYSNSTSNNNYYGHSVKSSGLSANTWHCAAITYTSTGNTSVTYYNGSATGLSRSSVGSPSGQYTTFNDLNIGRGFHLGGGERYYTGRVGAVQIYNTTLTADDISQNFNALRSRFGI